MGGRGASSGLGNSQTKITKRFADLVDIRSKLAKESNDTAARYFEDGMAVTSSGRIEYNKWEKERTKLIKKLKRVDKEMEDLSKKFEVPKQQKVNFDIDDDLPF